MNKKDLLAASIAAIISTAALVSPATDRLEGLSLDSLHWLRHTFFNLKPDPQKSPTVVIAIDEETFHRQPFRELPKVMWTKQLGQIINAVSGAGAKVIGMDLILPTSVERYVRGFDRDLLIAMRNVSRKNQLVLGKVQHQAKPIAPHPGQSFAVGHQKNIRLVNIKQDNDGVIRRLQLTLQSEDLKNGNRRDPVMAVELVSRALQQPATLDQNGALKLGDVTVNGTQGNQMTLNFDYGSQSIPAYSFADIFACAQKDDTEFLIKHFKGKVVLIGTALDEEDRRVTSKRFITGAENFTHVARCHHSILKEVYRPKLVRDSIPGVFIHATAVNNILQNRVLSEFSIFTNATITLVVSLLIAFFTMMYPPIKAGAHAIGLGLLWLVLATSAFEHGLVLSLFEPLIAMGLTFSLLLGYRFTVSDKDKRYIREVFSYYLPPAIIEKMTNSEALPKLGGEAREVTILFSDIAKFSTLSESLSASAVATFLNEYLSEMSDILEDHGAFIEKFVADEITAVFGAPMDDLDHALHAVQAALACQGRLKQMQGAFGLPADQKLAARIGINSGEMLVGNIGSYRRFTYAAMGDAANLGSRLEGANKFYDSNIMVGENTANQCDPSILFREIDSIVVVGRETSIRVFEPLGSTDDLEAEIRGLKVSYEEALALYRLGQFAGARDKFGLLAAQDPVSNVMLERCLDYLKFPPENWNGSYQLDRK
ncbi:MAG: adenylate/guanylate cyclase domain-containing protein [Rhodospirillaceae bacterium]|jgi:adenylate cyclase|nr:adenylate/guanylate cyclase domain-containing protein [Rhodospirillaceae bacterium]MBT5939553.1 adenylate/guanylate cyclase domain-containing protein [Rhodospirillaceae bacterium]MBT7955160.1 adenylate/guanylate cyclase domain-containing protein [Rhodospirillaceae bacterium]